MEKPHKYVIIDGNDPVTNTVIEKINVWKNYENRSKGVVSFLGINFMGFSKKIRVKHGQRVRLISKKGDRLEIRAWLHKGFISRWFTMEYKDG